MAKFEYYTPMDIASAFRTEQDVAVFLEYEVEELVALCAGKGDDFVPPIVYNQQGRVFNIEHNFTIKCLAKFLEDEAILGDFSLVENASGGAVVKAAMFLINGIFEDYFGIVRANNNKIDLSRYKSRGTVDMTKRFYNVIVMKNGSNVRRFSATPFSEKAIKTLMSAEVFQSLEAIAKDENLEQVAFGIGKYKEYIEDGNPVPEYVEI